ncbi:shikimate dehydrogenase [Suttonella sp. R2A3]|uniref:shikimate dehydrogenase n=1 Tax=Suttonella sp. R2A3 TaxID=2908648 RepID=UPI001F168189|nr:shikimate dehydrogenase [Suttonella sp. R2A3]UJF23881.1 shikimate dehydrogenase [Suttonella sp. R2A3]
MSACCAVIGNPVAHSRSPDLHHGFAQTCGIPLHYEKILAEEDDFAHVVQAFFASGGRGLNITVPFKQRAAELADHCSEEVRLSGAANTLWHNEQQQLCADNTDGRGLVNALTAHGVTLSGQRILLIGAGGAAQGVYHPLLASGPAVLDIANRTPEKAEAIIANQGGDGRAFGLDEHVDEPYDLIINATSSGLDDSALKVPANCLAPGHSVCYDMVYGTTTPFMRWAEEQQAAAIYDGYSMLIEQARLSFSQWFGVLPPVQSYNDRG